MKTGLCIIFNHPFPEQLPLLRVLYGTRFDRLLFLVPFESMTANDVQTVYRGGYSFDGMIVEARERIKKTMDDCDYIAFVHDDLLLSPKFNQANLHKHLALGTRDCFVPFARKIAAPIDNWVWFYALPYKVLYPMDQLLGTGAEKARKYLPHADIIAAACRRHQFVPSNSVLTPMTGGGRAAGAYFSRYIDDQLFGRTNSAKSIDLEYPFFEGYSDFAVVGRGILDEWIHVLGILSAMQVFPEIAIPTASVWLADKLSTLPTLGATSSILWGQDRAKSESLDWVIDRFDQDDYFVHPVKLKNYGLDKLLSVFSRFANQSEQAQVES